MTLNPFDQNCRAMLDGSPNRQSRHSIRSAFHHLECATTLIDVDLAMAAFRALTAEEEAATGLMHCLKERGYRNADKLRPKDHVQKNAISPFIEVVGASIGKTVGKHFVDFKLLLDGEGNERRLMIALPMTINGEVKWAQPIPPLNFSVTVGGKAPSYRAEIDSFLQAKGRNDIIEYLKAQANRRNLLLYAGPNGFPSSVVLPDGFFEACNRRVLILLRAYLLIQPYNEKLSFVQDSLDAFLNMMGSLTAGELHELL